MKKSCFFVLAFLMIGAVAFAQSDSDFVNVGGGGSLGGEISLGFIMDLDKEKDVDTLVVPGVDLDLRAYFVNLGSDYQPMNIGMAAEISLGFPSAINWKVPGLKEIKKDKDNNGNAFWPGGFNDPSTGNDPKPIKVGSQTLLPGKTVQFSKEAGDFDGNASLFNISFLIGASFSVGFGGGVGLVADLGFAGSYDIASFKSPEYKAVGNDGNEIPDTKDRQVIELSTFNGGIGGNLGLQYRIPLAGNSQFIIEVGSGLCLFFSRTSEVNWYTERNGSKDDGKTLWKDKTDPETVTLFRTAPYIKVGFSF